MASYKCVITKSGRTYYYKVGANGKGQPISVGQIPTGELAKINCSPSAKGKAKSPSKPKSKSPKSKMPSKPKSKSPKAKSPAVSPARSSPRKSPAKIRAAIQMCPKVTAELAQCRQSLAQMVDDHKRVQDELLASRATAADIVAARDRVMTDYQSLQTEHEKLVDKAEELEGVLASYEDPKICRDRLDRATLEVTQQTQALRDLQQMLANCEREKEAGKDAAKRLLSQKSYFDGQLAAYRKEAEASINQYLRQVQELKDDRARAETQLQSANESIRVEASQEVERVRQAHAQAAAALTEEISSLKARLADAAKACAATEHEKQSLLQKRIEDQENAINELRLAERRIFDERNDCISNLQKIQKDRVRFIQVSRELELKGKRDRAAAKIELEELRRQLAQADNRAFGRAKDELEAKMVEVNTAGAAHDARQGELRACLSELAAREETLLQNQEILRKVKANVSQFKEESNVRHQAELKMLIQQNRQLEKENLDLRREAAECVRARELAELLRNKAGYLSQLGQAIRAKVDDRELAGHLDQLISVLTGV
jgi:chromosome segregation ATPase